MYQSHFFFVNIKYNRTNKQSYLIWNNNIWNIWEKCFRIIQKTHG